MKNTLISLILCAFIFSSCSYGKSIGLYRKGLKKAEMEQYHEAIEIFNEGISLDNNLKFLFHEAKAGCLFELKEYNSTLKELEICIKNKDEIPDRNLSQIYFLKGTTEGQIGQNDLEIESFKKSIFYNSENIGSYISLGYNLNNIEEYEEAIEVLNKAIELDPESSFAFNNRAQSKIGIGNLKGAEKDLEVAFSFNNNNPYIFYNKYLLFKAQNESEKACEMINKALRTDFEHADYVNLKIKLIAISIAECNFLNGNLKEKTETL
jgi:tetratricopeptide (TPR) repeat protein